MKAIRKIWLGAAMVSACYGAVVPSPAAATGLTPGPKANRDPFPSVFQQQQHFAYRAAGGAIWDVWYDLPTNTWNVQELNLGGKTSGPAATDRPFVSVFLQQQHFAYRASDGGIWDVWYDLPTNTWNVQEVNLGGMTTAPAAAGNPSVSTFQQQQHFAYRDSAGEIIDVWYDEPTNSWNQQKINAGGKTNGPLTLRDPFVSVFQQQQHFTYNRSGLLWDIFYDLPTNTWTAQYLNVNGKTTAPWAQSDAFASQFQDQQHFVYRAYGGVIEDVWYDGPTSSWNAQQLNMGGQTQGPAAVGVPTVSVFLKQQHFTYRAAGGMLWDAWFDLPSNSWNLQELNLGGQTAGPFALGNTTGSAFQDQQHFPYRTTNGGIWDVWYDGVTNSWNLQELNLGAF